jgi:hypothetical protein
MGEHQNNDEKWQVEDGEWWASDGKQGGIVKNDETMARNNEECRDDMLLTRK